MGLATEVLRDMYVLTKGKMPIIGVGGVATAEDAYAKIRAGMAIFILHYKIFARELEALYHTFQPELVLIHTQKGRVSEW